MTVKLNLLATGGSDCHGPQKGLPIIGTKQVPYEILEIMKQKVASYAGSLL